jgi:alpha-beta hydrolase superfamily lysophospholipase
VGIALAAAIAASCSSGASGSKAFAPPPAGLPAFYSVPKQVPLAPGVLLKWQRLASGGPYRLYRVMYSSRSELGKPIAVTGLVYVPDGKPPSRGFDVVAWAHGTNGMAPQCAPSYTAPEDAVPYLTDLLAQGWLVVAPDYQGEGSPGPLPYIVGKVAAQNTVDAVRAAGGLPGVKLSRRYVVWGHSEGGQTAMFAWKIGPTYAPELRLEGVVAGAPPSQLRFIYDFLTNSPFKFYLLMTALGFHTAYGSAAPLDAVLTPKAESLLPQLLQGCAVHDFEVVYRYPLSELVKQDPAKVPAWAKLINENDPGQFTSATTVPLLVIHGGSDEQIPVASSALLASHLCSLGARLQRWVYPGQSHGGVVTVSMKDMVRWIRDRFEGVSMPDPMRPSGLPDVVAQTCASGFS